jgi:hypothetical protein
MKLIVSPLRVLDHYISREFAYVIRELIEAYGWNHVETAALRADPRRLSEILRADFGEVPGVVLFWESYGLVCDRAAQIEELDCLKVVFADDLHRGTNQDTYRYSQLLAYMLCDVVLSTYAYRVHDFFPEARNFAEVVWVPHAASPDFLLPFNEDAEDAIVLSGALSRAYPMRQTMKEIHDRGCYRIRHHPHPGYHTNYDHGHDHTVGPGYARVIGKYRVAFTDCLIHRYVVAKHFEIPAVGALLLADRAVVAPLDRLGFAADDHYVAASAEDLEEKIRYVLADSNRRKIDDMRRRAWSLVRQSHTTSDRARLIDDVCRARQITVDRGIRAQPPSNAPSRTMEQRGGHRDHSEDLPPLVENNPTSDRAVARILRDLNDRGIAIASFEELFRRERWAMLAAIGDEFLESKAACAATRAFHEGLDRWLGGSQDIDQIPIDYFDRSAVAAPKFRAEDLLFGLGLDPRLLDVVNGFARQWTRLRQFDLTMSLPPPPGVHRPRTAAQNWHRDVWDQIKVFLYLTDTDAGNGALEYIPGSRRGGAYESLWPFSSGPGPKGYLHPTEGLCEERVPEQHRVVCAASRGSVVFFDTTGLHRGGYAIARPRLVASWAYYRPSARVDRNFRCEDHGTLDTLSAAARFALGGSHPRD